MDESSLRTLELEELRAVYTLSNRSGLRLPRGSRSVARLFDGLRTVAQICAAGGVSITRGLSLVDQLARLALLVAVRSVPRLAEGGFTESEEAFFASDVKDDELQE